MKKEIYTVSNNHYARICNQLRKGGFKRIADAYWVRIYERNGLEIVVHR